MATIRDFISIEKIKLKLFPCKTVNPLLLDDRKDSKRNWRCHTALNPWLRSVEITLNIQTVICP